MKLYFNWSVWALPAACSWHYSGYTRVLSIDIWILCLHISLEIEKAR